MAKIKGRIARAQRVAARRKPKPGQPASNNYRKAQLRVAKLHQRVRRQRADFLHILSHHYANNHSTVVIEDLRVRNMIKSAKGTKAKPGTKVRQKAALNREIQAVGWYELRRQLAYKCERTGAKLIVVDPRYTSQKCQHCGEVDPKSRVTQMLFMCTSCGMIDHADVNAAKNILDRGIGPAGTTTVAVCGGSASRRPKKQKEIRVSELEKGIAASGAIVGVQ